MCAALAFAALMLGAKIYARDAKRTFTVYSEHGGSVVGATVVIDGITQITNSSGDVTFYLPSEENAWILRVSAPGYCSQDFSVVLHSTPRWNWIGLTTGCTN